jgi:hypothetical protein
MVLLLLTGCIFELFNQRTTYLATEYTIEHPRIVALSLNPPRIEPGQDYETDALMAAPPDMEVQKWTLKTCALGRDVPTYIDNLNCFNDPTEITVLATGTELPLKWTPPEIPEISCNWGGYEMDTAGKDDSGLDPPCNHDLPLVLEATVDDQPVLAAAFVRWFSNASPRPQPVSMREARVELRLPDTARAGDAIDVEILVENDRRDSSFFWYVDAGTLGKTGWTSAQSWVVDDPAWTEGRTGSTNRWVLPDDASGDLRLMVTVVPCPPGNDCRGGSWKMDTEYGLNMTWAQGAVEVAQ